jgi:hypothetical protein
MVCTICESDEKNTCYIGNGKKDCTYTKHVTEDSCKPLIIKNMGCDLDNCSKGYFCNNDYKCIKRIKPSKNP